MTQTLRAGLQLLLLSSLSGLLGCASPVVDPPTARAGEAYIDLYCENQTNSSWDVQRLDPASQRYKLLFSDLKPLKHKSLRLAVKPGDHRLRIAFLNQVIVEPAVVDVTTKDSMVSPIRVSLEESGAAQVQEAQTRTGGTFFGRFGRGTRIQSATVTGYRIQATPLEALPYQPKALMKY
jgi:hypothetical protein